MVKSKSDNAEHADGIQVKPAVSLRLPAFVGAYLLLILVLLTLLRYAAGTLVMDAYLFNIAQQCQGVIRILGEPAQLENPEQFKGRETEVRAKLAAGRDVANNIIPKQEEVVPLTPRECWNFRRLELRRDIQLESRKEAPDSQRLGQLEGILKTSGPVVFCGALQSSPTFQFQVVPDCSGLSAMVIFGVAVVIFPTLWRKRVLGIVLGVLLLHGINVLRLAFLALLGVHTQGGAWFVFMHNYAWEVINIFLIIFLWLVWIEVLVRPKQRQARAQR